MIFLPSTQLWKYLLKKNSIPLKAEHLLVVFHTFVVGDINANSQTKGDLYSVKKGISAIVFVVCTTFTEVSNSSYLNGARKGNWKMDTLSKQKFESGRG